MASESCSGDGASTAAWFAWQYGHSRVPGSSAKLVYLPAGTYRITDTISFPESRIVMQGAGVCITLLKHPVSHFPVDAINAMEPELEGLSAERRAALLDSLGDGLLLVRTAPETLRNGDVQLV